MHTKFFAVVALATAVAAVPTASANDLCNVGSIQCCNSVQDANSNTVLQIAQQNSVLAGFLKLLPANTLVGVTCNPIGIAGGINGNSCNAQTVCCENNSFNGAVAIGCTPININA